MDIVQAFNSNNLHTEITIKGTQEDPLFRASDIGLILDIKQIRNNIKDYDPDEKVAHLVNTPGGPQEVLFLTEVGLYRLLNRSNKPIARDFQKWVAKVIKNIRLTGKYELEKQLIEKDKIIEETEVNHKLEIKTNKHNILIDKFNKKNCVYISEIEENKFIKIGSTKDISDRNKGLNRTFGNSIFLEVFECDNFRKVEENILSDFTIKQKLYREKINGHQSQEIVKIDESFNFEQLMNIVHNYVNQISFYTPTQLLEKQKLDLEKQKLDLEKQKLDFDMLSKLLNNSNYIDIIKDILNKNLFITINNNLQYNSKNNQLINEQINENMNLEIQQDTNQEISNEIIRQTQNPNYKMNLDIKIKGRKPKGRKVQKIDSNNLQNIIKVYDSMIYVLRCPENKGFQKSSIQKAIKENRIYKGFRWNFVEEDEDPNISKIDPTNEYNSKPPLIDTIIELNYNKTEITDSFYTKDYVALKYKIGKKRMKDIILNNELYNNHYYIEHNKCPQNLLDNYKNPINRIIPKHSKLIKQIHPITKESIIFNSLSEIYTKFGIASKTIIDSLENNTICNGFIWQYI
jgi:prophage antirepressor-like protein